MPFMVDVNSSGSGRGATAHRLANSRTNEQMECLIYYSDPYSGRVYGTSFDYGRQTFSDVFVAVGTDLIYGLCEFQVANAIVPSPTTVGLCGRFRRTENYDPANYYTMIFMSTDGRTFSLERNSLINWEGLDYHVIHDYVNDQFNFCDEGIYAHTDPTWWILHPKSQTLTIPSEDIVDFSDTNLQTAKLSLKAGDEYYADHEYVVRNIHYSIAHAGLP
jgi:hypothetical protein